MFGHVLVDARLMCRSIVHQFIGRHLAGALTSSILVYYWWRLGWLTVVYYNCDVSNSLYVFPFELIMHYHWLSSTVGQQVNVHVHKFCRLTIGCLSADRLFWELFFTYTTRRTLTVSSSLDILHQMHNQTFKWCRDIAQLKTFRQNKSFEIGWTFSAEEFG